MEMLGVENLESREAGPTLPTLCGNPFGFPHSHDFDDWIYVFPCPLNPNISTTEAHVCIFMI